MTVMRVSKNKVLAVGVVALICGVLLSGAARFMNNAQPAQRKFSKGRVEVHGLNSLNGSVWQGRLTAATARAQRDLSTFKKRLMMEHWKDKPEIMQHYGNRPDAFFLRFLQVAEHEGAEDSFAVTLITNYAEFMNARRKEGLLSGLGASMVKEAASAGYIRVMSSKYRDSNGRRIILTNPANMDKVSEDLRSKLYLYLFLKFSTYDDALDPGFIIAHDFSGTGLLDLVSKAATSNAKRMLVQDTFPMNLKKIILMNYGHSFLMSPVIALFKQFQPAHTEMVYLPYATSDGGIYEHIPKTSLPTGDPYDGTAEEDITAALKPGLGALYEPEMDAEENKEEI